MQSRNAGTNEFTLQPGEAFSLAVHAEYVLIEKASGPVHLSVDEGGRQELTAGFAYYAAGANGFSKLEFLNDGAGAIAVRIQYGWGELKDTRLTVSGTVDTREETPSSLVDLVNVTIPSGAAATIAPANANRAVLIVKNLGNETVWLGGAGIASERGLPLAPGEKERLRAVGLVRAFNPIGVPVELSCAEIVRI